MAMTVQNLVTSQQARSNLRWLAGQSGGDRPLHGAGVHAVDQIGYLNLMSWTTTASWIVSGATGCTRPFLPPVPRH